MYNRDLIDLLAREHTILKKELIMSNSWPDDGFINFFMNVLTDVAYDAADV
jgi:hypothetical protein